MLGRGEVNGKIAKQVLARVIAEDRDPEAVVEQDGLRQITDSGELRPILERIVADNPRVAAQIAAGERKPAGFLVGQVMRHTAGRAHPDQVHALIDALYQPTPAGEPRDDG